MNKESRDYVSEQIAAIGGWKAAEPGVVARVVATALSPLTWLFNQIVPEKAIEAILNGADWLGEQTVPGSTESAATKNLREIDTDAIEVQNWAIAYAVGEGAAAGWFGFISAPVDIPAVIVLSLRTIRRVGLCYGYSGSSDREKEFVLGVLGCAGANSMKEKMAALYTLGTVQNMVAKVAFKKMAEKAAESSLSKEAAIIVMRDLAKQIGVNLTKRKMLAAIPAIGAIVGGSVNGWYLDDVGNAARRAYQERWLRDRRLWIDHES